MRLSLLVVSAISLLSIQSSAQLLPQNQYGMWLPNGLSSGSKFNVTASSRVIKDNTEYVYQIRLENTGPELVMVQWGILDKLISSSFKNVVSLDAGEVKNFSLKTSLEPTISETEWLRVYQWVDSKAQEDKENEVLDAQNLGKLTFPQGKMLQEKSGMGISIGVIPTRFR